MAPHTESAVAEHLPEFPRLCQSMADRSPQPIVAVEGGTHIVRYANSAFRRLLGKEEQHLIGRLFAEAVPEGLANGCDEMLDRVFATGVPEVLAEQEHRPRALGNVEQDKLPVHWSYLAWAILGLDEGLKKPIGVMIQVTDTSEIASFRKEAAAINEALLKTGVRLHELVGETERLAVGLRESAEHERMAHEEADAANKSKDVFLAMLSHELRTPLNAVLGWAVLLQMRAVQEDLPEDPLLDQGLAVIERNARAQGRLIEDMLDVARIVAGKFHLDRHPCDLAVVALAAADAVRPEAEAKEIVLEVRYEPQTSVGSLHLVADAPRLSQAILNLLTNAIKFTPKGGNVQLWLGRETRGGGDVVRVVVSDSGRGIDADALPFVFDRFKQANEGTTRNFGGLGLGLTIVRHIADLHGGSVTASSPGADQGATFTFELPVEVSGATPHSGTDDQPFDKCAPVIRLDGLRVLIVDDELDTLAVARMSLESAGATVLTAGSAVEAFRQLEQTRPPPHVLISDLAMPEEDGYSLLRRVRSAGHDAGRLPALALTALAGPEDRRRALVAGFQIHMQKPIDPHELIAMVGSMAGRTGP